MISYYLQEQQQHRCGLVQLAYSSDGSYLFTAGCDGGLCVYDVSQVYQPVKFLSAGVKDIRVGQPGTGPSSLTPFLSANYREIFPYRLQS